MNILFLELSVVKKINFFIKSFALFVMVILASCAAINDTVLPDGLELAQLYIANQEFKEDGTTKVKGNLQLTLNYDSIAQFRGYMHVVAHNNIKGT